MRELTIDWAALHSAFQMNMPEVRCFFATEDGRVLKLPPGDPGLATVRGDPQHYIAIEAVPSRIQYQWLDEFIRAIPNEDVKARMEAAINGKGAFRRFKDILLTLPDERRRWFEYRDQMMRQRIVEWVREQGINPLNPAPWLDDPNYAPPPMPDESPGQGLAGGAAMAPSSLGAFTSSPTMPPVPAARPEPQPVPDNLGNVAPGFGFAKLGRQQPVHNNAHEVEALRDFLIEWGDTRQETSTPGPLELEELASSIAKHFHVKSAHI